MITFVTNENPENQKTFDNMKVGDTGIIIASNHAKHVGLPVIKCWNNAVQCLSNPELYWVAPCSILVQLCNFELKEVE